MNPHSNDHDEDLNQFLPQPLFDPDKLSVEIPSESHPFAADRIPSGFEPMGEIELRGRAYRGLAEGRMPWWILISGWFIFGGFAAVILHAAMTASSLALWILLVIMLIPLLILGRGTAAKWAQRSRNH